MPTFPVLANTGAMSQFVGAFEVVSKLTGRVYQCRFFAPVELELRRDTATPSTPSFLWMAKRWSSASIILAS